MKRLFTIISAALLTGSLALPAVARAFPQMWPQPTSYRYTLRQTITLLGTLTIILTWLTSITISIVIRKQHDSFQRTLAC